MKKNIWLRYSRSENIIEIVVRDFSGAKLEMFKFKQNDKEKNKRN